MAIMSRNGKFVARIHHAGNKMGVGTFETKERAIIAEKIAKLWAVRGLRVPTTCRTIDAI